MKMLTWSGSHSISGVQLRSVAWDPRRALFFALCALTLLFAAPFFFAQSSARTAPPTEQEVEAAYLYNFGKFVTWPAESKTGPQTGTQTQSKAMNICVLGRDPFGASLDRIVANETIDGRPLAVVRLSNTSSVGACSILYIGGSEASHLNKDLSILNHLPILTVSDLPDFLDQGGTIQFVLEDRRVRFVVNLDAARKCGLVLSSQLLKVAEKVVGRSPREDSR